MAFFTPEQAAKLAASTVRIALLVRMEFRSSTKYLWNGNTDLVSGGQTWQPMRGMATIDGLSLSSGTGTESATFSLPGLPDDTLGLLALALEETPDVSQQLVTVFIQLFDEDWQPEGSPIGFWWGFMQPPRISRTPMGQTDGAVQSISDEALNAFYNRSRPPHGRYTDRDQQKRSPGDKFFQFTPSLLFKTFKYPDY